MLLTLTLTPAAPQCSTFGSTRASLSVRPLISFAPTEPDLTSSRSDYSDAALLSATFKRQVGTLEWWKNSGLPLKIGNVVRPRSCRHVRAGAFSGSKLISLDASRRDRSSTLRRWRARQVRPSRACRLRVRRSQLTCACARAVCLDWWANSGLPCRYSKAALYTLSKTGNIPLLTWWLRSRFPLSFDKEVLTIATRFGQTRVLQWWLESGVEIEYRFFDIEEAIEDCVGDRDAVTRWWEERGYNARMGANQWMRMRKLE